MDWGANFRTAIELILYLIAAVKNNKTTVPAKETATVYYVTDGDTVRVKIKGKDFIVRLIGVDTPEIKDPRKAVQCFGKEAGTMV